MASSARPAISSATAGAVTASGLPWPSTRPAWSSRTVRPAAPIAMSVCPSRQARPAVSVTTTPTLTPRAHGDLGPDPACGCVRVDGEQDEHPDLDVGVVDAGGGHGQAVPGAHDRGRSAAGDDPDRLGLDRGVAVGARDQPALGLAHHLAGHHDDVAVGEVDEGEEQRDQVVAGPDLGNTVRRDDGDRHVTSPTAAAAIAAVAVWSVMSSGTAAAARPPSCRRPRSPASRLSTSQPSSTPPAERAP